MEIEDQRKIIYNDLCWLNSNVFILDKVKEFPWNQLRIELSFRIFANSLFKNTFENTVIMIRRLYFETKTDFISIRFLKAQILKEKSSQKQKSIADALKPHETQLRSLEDKINKLRNHRFGHLSKNLIWEEMMNYEISLLQIKKLVQALNQIYIILFELSSETRFLSDDKYYLDSQNTDIDRVLDFIASESELLKLYEVKPELWEAYERNWKQTGNRENHLKVINHFRSKLFNLEPIK